MSVLRLDSKGCGDVDTPDRDAMASLGFMSACESADTALDVKSHAWNVRTIARQKFFERLPIVNSNGSRLGTCGGGAPSINS